MVVVSLVLIIWQLYSRRREALEHEPLYHLCGELRNHECVARLSHRGLLQRSGGRVRGGSLQTRTLEAH